MSATVEWRRSYSKHIKQIPLSVIRLIVSKQSVAARRTRVVTSGLSVSQRLWLESVFLKTGRITCQTTTSTATNYRREQNGNTPRILGVSRLIQLNAILFKFRSTLDLCQQLFLSNIISWQCCSINSRRVVIIFKYSIHCHRVSCEFDMK